MRVDRMAVAVQFRHGIVLAAVLVQCLEAAAATSEETVHRLEGLPFEVLWRPLPGATSSNTLPIIFLFHGQGGRPTVEPVATCPASSNFVLVGLPYTAVRAEPQTRHDYENALDHEWDTLVRVREELVRRMRWTGRSATYVGGTSMGGWVAAALFERHPNELAGALILLAGRMRSAGDSAPSLVPAASVYIGSGETDPNLPAARRAATWYRCASMRVTFEVFVGYGHQVPRAPPLLDGWLAWEAARQTLAPHFRTQFTDWWRAARTTLSSLSDPWTRYEWLKRLRADPRIATVDPTELQWAQSQWASLHGHKKVQQDIAAEDELEAALQAEWKARTMAELTAVRARLEHIARTFPDTIAARIAGAEAEILAQVGSRTVTNTPAAGAIPPVSGGTPKSLPRPLRVPPVRP